MYHKPISVPGPSYDGVDHDSCRKQTFEQEKYIEKCLLLANKSDLTQKHGCVLVRNKEIISDGYNFKIANKSRKNHSIFSVHAEVCTLKKVKNQDLSECELYVVRLGPPSDSSSMKYSYPCKVCLSYIDRFRIRKVYYSINCTH